MQRGFSHCQHLKNKTPGRKIQEPSLVMWLMPHPIGAFLEALRQAGHWRRALASLEIGDLLEELKLLGIQGEDVAHAVHMEVPSLQRGTAPHAAQPQKESRVRNHQLLSVLSKESHKYHLNCGCFPLLSHCTLQAPTSLRLLHLLQSQDPKPKYYTRRSRASERSLPERCVEHNWNIQQKSIPIDKRGCSSKSGNSCRKSVCLSL